MSINLNTKKDESLIINPSYAKINQFYNKYFSQYREELKNKPLNLYLDFLRWKLIDLGRPRFFHPYGLDFFVGLPGTGKTISLSYILYKYRLAYGDAINIETNYGFKYQDSAIDSYIDILRPRDKPTLIGFDEIQNEFDARDWKNLDQRLSARVTQSRKLMGMQILGTTQDITFVDVRLRRLGHSAVECKTISDRMTVMTKRTVKDMERITDSGYRLKDMIPWWKKDKFVQSDPIRELYDSYQILESAYDKFKTEEAENRQFVSKMNRLLTNADVFAEVPFETNEKN